MIAMSEIRKVGRRIAREFNPEHVILFGSYARGTASQHSGVDVLVVMPFRGRSVRKAAGIRLRVRPGFPVDLIVRTPAAIHRRLKMGDVFIEEILREGKVLYEAHRRCCAFRRAARGSPGPRPSDSRLDQTETPLIPAGCFS